MTADLDISTTIQVTGNVTLDLNGYVLQYNGTTVGSVITVENSLTLKDSSTVTEEAAGTATKHYFNVDSNGLWNWCKDTATCGHSEHKTVTGGVITGGNGSQYGGVYVRNNSSFTMENGNIVGCKGSGVFLDENSSFIMNNGNIVGCTAPQGGGVYVGTSATFTMNDGTIKGCTATGTGGGGVYVNVDNGTFTMKDGTIESCTANGGNDKGGGGVYLHSITDYTIGSNFTMEGGTIKDCTTTGYGGGVCLYKYIEYSTGATGPDANFTMKDGTISNNFADQHGGGVYDHGVFKMEGGKITGNTAGLTGGGVCVAWERTFTVGGDSTKTVTITGNKEQQQLSDSTYDSDVWLAEGTSEITVASGGMKEDSEIFVTRAGTRRRYIAPLDLSSAASITKWDDTIGGYKWDNSTKTLTLKDIEIAGELKLPSNATVKIDGTVVVGTIGEHDYVGPLTIERASDASEANLRVTSTTGGIVLLKGSLTLKNLTADISSFIYGNSDSSYDGLIFEKATITTNSISWTYNDTTPNAGITLKNNSKVTVKDGSIFADSITIDINDTSELTLDNSSISAYASNHLSGIIDYCPDDGKTYTIGEEGGTPYLMANSAVVKNLTLKRQMKTVEVPYTITVTNGGSVNAPARVFTLTVMENNGTAYDFAGHYLTLEGNTVSASGTTSTGTLKIKGERSTVNDVLSGGLFVKQTTAATDTEGWTFANNVYCIKVDLSTGSVKLYGANPELNPDGTVHAYNQGDEVTSATMTFANTYTGYNVTWNANGGTVNTAGATTSGAVGTAITAPTNAPTKAEDANYTYAFAGWYTEDAGGTKVEAFGTITGDVTYYAHWTATPRSTPTPTPTPTVTRYTITATAGEGGAISPEGSVRVKRGDDQSFTITPEAGYRVSSVLVDGKEVGALTGYTFENVRKAHTISVTFAKSNVPVGLNSTDHVAYVQGYPDGTVGPEDSITRAQTAMMLYRLMTDEHRAQIETDAHNFTDVPENAWYRTAVATMANGGYINGYTDGRFGGEDAITRAEFVAALVRFLGVRDVSCRFTDVSANHWAYGYIATAVDAGWITGFSDGTFRPDQPITRAEVMAVINRALERGVDAASGLLDFKQWPDNSPNNWYYYEVIEATNGHDYTGSRPSEQWTKLK